MNVHLTKGVQQGRKQRFGLGCPKKILLLKAEEQKRLLKCLVKTVYKYAPHIGSFDTDPDINSTFLASRTDNSKNILLWRPSSNGKSVRRIESKSGKCIIFSLSLFSSVIRNRYHYILDTGYPVFYTQPTIPLTVRTILTPV